MSGVAGPVLCSRRLLCPGKGLHVAVNLEAPRQQGLEPPAMELWIICDQAVLRRRNMAMAPMPSSVKVPGSGIGLGPPKTISENFMFW